MITAEQFETEKVFGILFWWTNTGTDKGPFTNQMPFFSPWVLLLDFLTPCGSSPCAVQFVATILSRPTSEMEKHGRWDIGRHHDAQRREQRCGKYNATHASIVWPTCQLKWSAAVFWKAIPRLRNLIVFKTTTKTTNRQHGSHDGFIKGDKAASFVHDLFSMTKWLVLLETNTTKVNSFNSDKLTAVLWLFFFPIGTRFYSNNNKQTNKSATSASMKHMRVRLNRMLCTESNFWVGDCSTFFFSAQ